MGVYLDNHARRVLPVVLKIFILSFFKVYSVETGASQFSRASACLQWDTAGSLPAHGGRLWKLRYPEVFWGAFKKKQSLYEYKPWYFTSWNLNEFVLHVMLCHVSTNRPLICVVCFSSVAWTRSWLWQRGSEVTCCLWPSRCTAAGSFRRL